jgi:acyl-CoA thioesterase YciA
MNITYPNDRQPTLRIIARPIDVNTNGSIFGGWLMAQIDIAASISAAVRAQGPIATVAVQSLQFINPLFPDDYVSFYTEVTSVGRTSLTISVEVYAHRAIYGKVGKDTYQHELLKIADAVLIFVAVGKPGEKRLVPKE